MVVVWIKVLGETWRWSNLGYFGGRVDRIAGGWIFRSEGERSFRGSL